MSSEISRRRRAMLQGLANFVDGEELLSTLCHWEENFSSQPMFAFNAFVCDLRIVKEQPGFRSKIIRALTEALYMDDLDLPPDPLDSMNHFRQIQGIAENITQAKSEDSSTDILLAIKTVADFYLKKLTLQQNKQLFSKLLNRMTNKGWSFGDAKEVRDYFVYEKIPNVHLAPAKAREVNNLLYVEVCNILGPSEADRMLTAAYRHLQNSNLKINPDELF